MTDLSVVKLEETLSVLSFNPVSKKKESFYYQITPAEAQFILDYHNNDNRKLCPSQVNKIDNSVVESGWVFDGNPIIFNTAGNITESQHRLNHIAANPNRTKKYGIIVVLGAELDSFSKAAVGKPRRAHDEVYRKDNTALASQTAILGDLLSRIRDKKLSMTNAVSKWFDWKSYIVKAFSISDNFFTETSCFSTQTKTIGAWVTLCVRHGYGKIAEEFLELLEEEINGTNSCKLTMDFMEYWKSTWEESNEGRLKILYMMLCVATDRLLKKPDGRIALDITSSKLDHKSMKGTYKKFLV